jgi:hypothetical protein
MIATSKWLTIVAVAFVSGSFIASPELRAYAANTIGSADIINESILSEDIKNSQVKASDLAADSVGGSELIGVTKLLFGQCAANSSEGTTTFPPGAGTLISCSINGVNSDDSVIAQMQVAGGCFDARASKVIASQVEVAVYNQCSTSQQIGTGTQVAVIVFDK